MTTDPLPEMDTVVKDKTFHFQVIYEIEIDAPCLDEAVMLCAEYYGEYGHRLMPDRITLDVSKMFFEGE